MTNHGTWEQMKAEIEALSAEAARELSWEMGNVPGTQATAADIAEDLEAMRDLCVSLKGNVEVFDSAVCTWLDARKAA